MVDEYRPHRRFAAASAFLVCRARRAWSCGLYGPRLVNRGVSAPLTSHPSIGKGEERSAFSRGETCQKSGGFHQLERGLRGGRGDARNSDFADLALCSSAACRFSSEDRTTPFRCLLLMKTTRFLAGLRDICAHPEIGGARDKLPSPCLIARALLRRPLATNPIGKEYFRTVFFHAI